MKRRGERRTCLAGNNAGPPVFFNNKNRAGLEIRAKTANNGAMKILKTAIALAACAHLCATAEVKTPAIFSDGMMLQQNSANIWGTAEPGAKIEIEILGEKSSARAGKNGEWSARVKTPGGSPEPREVKIYENGKLAKTFSGVIFGDVWIAGGQSNMDFGLRGIDGAKAYIDSSADSGVRYFAQGASSSRMFSARGIGKDPEREFPEGSRWVSPNPQNAGGLQGIPYIFAAELAKASGKPVGIVYTGTPGTKMAAWVSRKTYENSPLFKRERENFAERSRKYDYKKEKAKFDEDVRTYGERVRKAKAEGKEPPPAWTVAPFLAPWPDSPDKWSTPSMLFNLRVNPLRGYAARGIIWYQGESDSHDGFADKFEGLIGEWREVFGSPEMPFFFVQLPSHNAWKWELTRAEQEKISKKLKNVSMVCAIDTGEENDVHPRDKIEIGKRLAKAALAGSGKIFPSLRSIDFRGGVATVRFKYRKGLECRGKCRGFEMLSGGKWSAADAEFDGKRVVLKSPDGSEIEGARYLWKPWAKPDACLFDAGGNPVPPFQSLKGEK